MAPLHPLADWRDLLWDQEAPAAGGGMGGHWGPQVWGGGLLRLDKLFPSHYSERRCLKQLVKVEFSTNDYMSLKGGVQKKKNVVAHPDEAAVSLVCLEQSVGVKDRYSETTKS